MTIARFKLPLNAARFPLVSTKGQRAVFVPGLDAAPRTPRIFMGAEESVDYNLAQILYGENFMPTAEGVHSVGYTQLIAPTVNTDFDSIFALRDADENTVLFSPSKGKNYIYDNVANLWDDNPIATIIAPATLHASSDPTQSKVTYAYVDGKTFVCYRRLKTAAGADASIYYWNGTTLVPAGALITNLVNAFPVGEIDGISSSNGYLLVWSQLTIAWAPFNGTAFNFSIYENDAFTGAGYQIPEDIQGNIRAVLSIAGGFAMFTDRNAVAANYHAQALNAPWVFREIANAGGLESYEQATVEGTLGSVYAYTTTGMQLITLNSAESIMPDVADFIALRQIERIRLDTQELYQGSVNLDLYTKVTNIGNRYVVISYGTVKNLYSFALVYDLALKRWGKLRMVHRDCFYYSYGFETAGYTYSALGDVPYDSNEVGTYESTKGQSNAFTAAPHGLAFMKSNGQVLIADWSDQYREAQDEAVVVLGRVQLSRTSNVQLNRVEVEGLKSGQVFIQPSYDGRNLEAAEALTDVGSLADLGLYGCMVDCKNFNITVRGTFSLSTVILEATTSGKI